MKASLSQSIVFSLRFIMLIWAVFILDLISTVDLAILGVYPQNLFGLIGIVTMPLVHASWSHLISNSIPLAFLCITLFFFFNKISYSVFFLCYFFTGFLVWIFARHTFHIGASGLVYAIAAFLMFFGFFRKDIKSLFISIIIIMLYGGMVYGIFPNQPGVSWESHLLGGIVGICVAFYYRSKKMVSS